MLFLETSKFFSHFIHFPSMFLVFFVFFPAMECMWGVR